MWVLYFLGLYGSVNSMKHKSYEAIIALRNPILAGVSNFLLSKVDLVSKRKNKKNNHKL